MTGGLYKNLYKKDRYNYGLEAGGGGGGNLWTKWQNRPKIEFTSIILSSKEYVCLDSAVSDI